MDDLFFLRYVFSVLFGWTSKWYWICLFWWHENLDDFRPCLAQLQWEWVPAVPSVGWRGNKRRNSGVLFRSVTSFSGWFRGGKSHLFPIFHPRSLLLAIIDELKNRCKSSVVFKYRYFTFTKYSFMIHNSFNGFFKTIFTFSKLYRIYY